MSTGGRPTLFKGKDKTHGRISGFLTPYGKDQFEHARRRLARLVSLPATSISDADTAEALARGWKDTEQYLSCHRLR